MLQLIGLVVSVGLADSLNPSTIGPALYLATGPAPARKVVQFTAGVFLVLLAGGLVIALGPGEILFRLLPHPSSAIKHLIQLGVGIALLGASIVLWIHGPRLAVRQLPGRNLSGSSAFLLGAGISLVEFPTAVPYFAVIAAVVGADVDALARVELITLFCAAFCTPLLVIAALLLISGERAKRPLARAGNALQAHWPALLAALLALIGTGFAIFGAVGLARR